MNSFGLSAEHISKITACLRQSAKIEKALLYGSRAKGNFKPGSDIDLTLIAPTMTLTELLELENKIDDLLLPYKMDLSLLHQIENPDLVEHIQRVGKVFFAR
jgi:predicted nucleotidyltransferase